MVNAVGVWQVNMLNNVSKILDDVGAAALRTTDIKDTLESSGVTSQSEASDW